MSFLGTMFSGISTLLGYEGRPQRRSYAKIKIYGEATFDDVHVLDYEYSESGVNTLDIDGEVFYDVNTIMLAQFENENLSGGNITNVSEPIESWEFNRREVNTDILTTLGEVPIINVDEDVEFIDSTAAKNMTYEYVVFGITENEITEPLISLPLDVNYYGHIFINEDSNVAYLFDLNIESGEIENITDVSRYDGYNKYSAYSFGKRDFEVGSITAIAGEVATSSNSIEQPISLLSEIRAFINNGKSKIYKTPKGEIFEVVTRDNKRAVLSDRIKDQPYIISFVWEEIGKKV